MKTNPNHQVIVIDNLSNSFRAVFETVEKLVSKHYNAQGREHQQPSLRFHEADFTDEKAMTVILKSYEAPLVCSYGSSSSRYHQLSRITGVIHFAANTTVGESIQNPK
jgi:UDP-glucose 4-epimerase